MIGLTSPKLTVNASKEELIDFLKQPSKSLQIYEHKVIRHLKAEPLGFSFILKRGAAFNYKVKIPNREQILMISRNEAPFDSFLIFKFPEENSVIIEFEADTTPFMDYFIANKLEEWLNSIAQNLIKHFK